MNVFECTATCSTTRARAGWLRLPRGVAVPTPCFMPVGTAGAVKAMRPEELDSLGARICLANTYHLMLRPGVEVVAAHGGLHRMMAWDGAILTDSGGFQVFSLASLARVDDHGVRFQSHLDGSPHELTPERAVAIQEALGSDIAMVLDVCPPSTASRDVLVEAMRRTTAWARRCLDAHTRSDQLLFGIVQGGVDPELRAAHARELTALPFDGFAIGGLSVGEPTEQLHALVTHTAPLLPAQRPRYLMGVGTPEDLLAGIAAGVDMFDCVLPTRCARNGRLFTSRGDLNIRNSRFRTDLAPVDPECTCSTCRRFSRAYLRHLHVAREILYAQLATTHNLHFYLDLMRQARAHIVAGTFETWRNEVLARRAARGVDSPGGRC